MEDILSLEVAFFTYIVDAAEDFARFLPKNPSDFCLGPDKEFPLFSFAVGILCGIESALAVKHLAHQVGHGFIDHLLEKRLSGDAINLRVDTNELSVVVEHLLEMGHEPLLVHRIAMKSTAQMIVNSPLRHLR